MPKILIVDGRTEQSQRYDAIAKLLVGPGNVVHQAASAISTTDISHAIVCSPTNTHADVLRLIGPAIPTLCETPIAKRAVDLTFLASGFPMLFMVNNFSFLQPTSGWEDDKTTAYQGWRSAADGAAFDLIQFLHLARSHFRADPTDPITRVRINGVRIDFNDIDNSYLQMMREFSTRNFTNLWGPSVWTIAHKKAEAYEAHITRYPNSKWFYPVDWESYATP